MPENTSLVALLARTDLFGSFSADELAACAAAFRLTRFNKGALLFARGDAGTHLYVVVEGRVRLAVTSEEGRELSFRHAVAGDLFGEIAALDGSPRTADATALTEVTAYALERKAFGDLWSARPGISAGVIAFLCHRLRETSGQLEAIALYPLEVRLARFLLLALGDREAPRESACHWNSVSPRANSRSFSEQAARRSTQRWARWRARMPSTEHWIASSVTR